jgi:hypothetical protein
MGSSSNTEQNKKRHEKDGLGKNILVGMKKLLKNNVVVGNGKQK